MIDLVKWVRSQKAAKKAHSITSILNNLKSLIKQVYQKGCTKKFLKRLSKFDILGVAQLWNTEVIFQEMFIYSTYNLEYSALILPAKKLAYALY